MNKHLFILGILCLAQQLFSQATYTYAGAEKINLEISTEYLLLKFDPALEVDEQVALLRSMPGLSACERKDLFPFRGLIFFDLPQNATRKAVALWLEQLNQSPGLLYAHPFFSSAPSGGKLMSYDENFVVKLKAASDLPLLQEIAGLYGLEIAKRHRSDPSLYFLRSSAQTPMDVLDLVNLLEESGLFAYAELDFWRFGLLSAAPPVPNDPLYVEQWHLENDGSYPQSPPYNTVDADIDAEAAWTSTTGNANIRIAVIDDGVNTTNPDLAGQLAPGYDATAGGATTTMTSETGHGNQVAELIAAKANNNLGGVGVAYDCRVIPVKVFENIPGYGGGNVTRDSWLGDGIDWAWENGHADILSNSWGGGAPSYLITDAISRALNSGRNGLGALSFFAAGNNNSSSIEYPSSLSEVVAVGATNSCDLRRRPVNAPSCDGSPTWGSNYGTGLDVAAPGNLITTSSGSFEGTSAATPIASGIAALILSKNPTLTASDVRFYLESNCEKVGGYTYNSNVSGQPNGTWSTDLGYGRVNANLALAAVPAPPNDDAGIAYVETPLSDCGLGSSEPVTVKVKNYGANALSNIPVEYRINFNNGGFGSWTSAGSLAGPLNMLEEAVFSFSINAYNEGSYTIEVRTQFSGDSQPANDLASYSFVHRKTINTFPYLEDFESDDGGWYPSDANNPFLLSPALSGNNFIKTIGSGNQAWLTTNPSSTEGYFPFQTKTYLYSPCLDFSGMSQDPLISFLFIHQLELSGDDYVALEMSTDGGTNWSKVGSQSSGTNWYNSANGWAESSSGGPGQWLEAIHELTGSAGFSNVQLRFFFYSDSDDPIEDGFGLDKVQIREPSLHDASVRLIKSPSDDCNLSNAQTVQVKITNRGASDITSCPVEYRYQINGGGFTNWLTAGTFNTTIAPGQEADYAFTANLSTKGTYQLEVRTQLPNDGDASNDAASKTFQHYDAVNSYPYSESFESGKGLWLEGGVNYSWDLGNPSGNHISSASDGTEAWVTNLTGPVFDGEQSYVESLCFDFSSLSNPQINFDIWWDNTTGGDGARLEASTDHGQTWSIIGVYNDPDNWYNTQYIDGLNNGDGWSGSAGGWLTARHALSALAGQPEVIFRIYFGESPLNSPNAGLDGFAFDNVSVGENTASDAGVLSINSPTPFGCSMSNSETVQVTIKNYGFVPISNIPLEYRIDYEGSGFTPWAPAGTYSGTIAAGNTNVFSFTADFSAAGAYVLEVRTQLPSDANSANDSHSKELENITSAISFFPYCEDFETGLNGWSFQGSASSWQTGAPAGSIINSPAGGTNVCATNLSGNYNPNESSYLLSPCLDLSAMNFGIISFDLWYETEATKDGLKLQYSVTGGETWVTEYTQTTPYNDNNIASFSGLDTQDGWAGSSGQWQHVEAYISPLGTANVLYRFIFASDNANVSEGVAIDNICIFDVDYNNIGYFNGCETLKLYGVSGNQSYHLLSPAGEIVATVQPNGNNLGELTFQVNDLATVPQANNGVYYMPRYFNVECSGGPDCPNSGNFPQGDVTLGLYFETPELNDYNTAGGTNYTFGSLNGTHFDGANENCTLNDNGTGSYTLISNSNISSYDYNSGAGFVLEMNIPGFSELGFHGTNSTLAPPPLPITLSSFNAQLTAEKTVHLLWSTAAETNNAYFDIQRSADGKLFESIGRVAGAGQSYSDLAYSFYDLQPLNGLNYYRLRQVDFDGQATYSPVEVVDVDSGSRLLLSIRPNPATTLIHIEMNLPAAGPVRFSLRDLRGQELRTYTFEAEKGRQLFELQAEDLPKGIYFLQASGGNRTSELRKVVLLGQ